MPLEISEIGVHLAVRGSGQVAQAAAMGAGCDSTGLTAAQKEEIVESCVRRVLQSLRDREAR